MPESQTHTKYTPGIAIAGALPSFALLARLLYFAVGLSDGRIDPGSGFLPMYFFAWMVAAVGMAAAVLVAQRKLRPSWLIVSAAASIGLLVLFLPWG